MICLSRLDGRELWINEDLVLTVERTPDTLLTTTSGLRVLVQEPVEEVVERIVAFRRRIAAEPGAKVAAVREG